MDNLIAVEVCTYRPHQLVRAVVIDLHEFKYCACAQTRMNYRRVSAEIYVSMNIFDRSYFLCVCYSFLSVFLSVWLLWRVCIRAPLRITKLCVCARTSMQWQKRRQRWQQRRQYNDSDVDEFECLVHIQYIGGRYGLTFNSLVRASTVYRTTVTARYHHKTQNTELEHVL